MTHDGLTHAVRCLIASGVLAATGCGEPTAPNAAFSTFNAEVRGVVNERITGTASAGADTWMRELATQITVSGETISVIALMGERGQTISFTRPGTDFPLGTHKLGFVRTATGMPKGGFASGYGLRRADGIQLFFADSGSITIAEAGSRVSGTFVLYASEYQVLPLPSRETVGQPITPLETGKGDITVTGSFAAARRTAR